MAAITTNAQDNGNNASQLPKNASTFMQKFFKTSTVSNVEKDHDDGRITYEVTLSNGTEIDFKQDGNWKEVDGNKASIPTGFIPKIITSYIEKNYKGGTITKIEKESSGYEVKLSTGMELKSDTNGKFTGIDD